MPKDHEYFMRLALDEAQKAQEADEVPVGAVLVSSEGMVLAQAQNKVIRRMDPTAHAEILVIRESGQKLSNYRLLNTTLYVSIEPCIMCMGAIFHARIDCLVFGASDPKWGAAGSLYDFSKDARLNHRIDVIGGVMEARARDLMQAFFKNKRS
ncbi:MAG: tRNA adenosine(34) deaminase TadA [Desulfobacterales bacterium CG07_land_8_20_14_0_80_52_14]|nr:MAG: tRNA adenosine(34) deaminase TadA [Desulfobacterales bacterium CG23_combo_of_CG06-09_8_20_14_all_52_9]PIU49671.1 MAG: tRNA adenosine(34) deaminase TadA [Desulfobacterales bacterium CG07_land_8_20_14_0_80_52_14]